MTRTILLSLSCAFLVAACGASTHSARPAAAPAAQATTRTTSSVVTTVTRSDPKPATSSRAAPAAGPTVKLVTSQYGQILADGRGQAFYLFAKEGSTQSDCYGACAQRWPPVLVAGRPHAGPGAQRRLLGTTRRDDGRLQLTYAGHPLYLYQGDSPGHVLCQGAVEFGGAWLVVRSTGAAVR